jgi:hypothetical protein
MLFGPSNALGSSICLSTHRSHRFDSCFSEACISKCFLQNKYLIEPYQQIGPIYIVGYIPDNITIDMSQLGGFSYVEFVALGGTFNALNLTASVPEPSAWASGR